jgi:hypothetical protein
MTRGVRKEDDAPCDAVQTMNARAKSDPVCFCITGDGSLN